MHEFPGYRIDRELGRGAMAVVYLATQLSLKRPVALKVLDRSIHGSADLAPRFIHEAHTLAGLRHRNIVSVHDVVESAQADFISMEYLDGGSLTERMAVGVTVQESLAILAQLGSALDAAHASGIVHRDIKPDNVLFRDADTPVLADFGIARELAAESHLTQDGLVLGTPSYMAPEQIAGETVDGRADQYSLGALWFQMLTGHVPYEADSTADVLIAHMARPIPQLPDPMAVLQPVVNRMLAKKPGERYPDMAAALLDISRRLLHAPELLRCPPGTPQVSPTERLHQLGFPTTGMHAAQVSGSTQVVPATSGQDAIKPPLAPGRRRVFGLAAVAVITLALVALGIFNRSRFQDAPAPAVTAGAELPTSDKSIAVLPFVNMSADKDQEFFADGISEELLNQLSKIPQLRVIARTSSFAFKGKAASVSDIARQLNVSHVLEGSVRKSGNRIRITAQLIRSADSSHLWSETYDREMTDVFAVQDDIAAAVMDQLKLHLLGGAPKARAVNPQAYALFLQGRQADRVGTAEGYARGELLLNRALAIDPNYAEAWTELAFVHMSFADSGLRPIAGSYRLAREAVNRALAIDPEFATAHARLGRIAMIFDGDFDAAARHLTRALALGPDDNEVRRTAGELASNLGRLDASIALFQALALRDPASAAAHGYLAQAYASAGRNDEAIASLRKALALTPDAAWFHYYVAMALLVKGDPEAALAELQLEPAKSGWRQIGMPMIWHALGETAKSDAALASLIADREKEAAFNIAYVHAYRGDADGAFEWLDKAIAYHDPGVSQIVVQRFFADIHADPRWLPLLHRLGRAPDQLAAIKFEVAPVRHAAAP